jgi:hypothetical protein
MRVAQKVLPHILSFSERKKKTNSNLLSTNFELSQNNVCKQGMQVSIRQISVVSYNTLQRKKCGAKLFELPMYNDKYLLDSDQSVGSASAKYLPLPIQTLVQVLSHFN